MEYAPMELTCSLLVIIKKIPEIFFLVTEIVNDKLLFTLFTIAACIVEWVNGFD